MRIAFVIARLDPAHGGVERYAWTLAAGLARREARVTVFTAEPVARAPAGVCVETLAPLPAGPREQRFDAAARARLGDLAGWDVVQGFGATTVHTLYRAGGGSHGAYLRAMQGEWSRWRRWWEAAQPRHQRRIATQRAIFAAPRTRFLANSERTRRDVCADYGVAPEHIAVLHNGVDLARFRPARPPARAAARARFGLGDDVFTVAFVGSGYARKGLRTALTALARLRREAPRAALLVAGRDRPAPWRRRARRLRVHDAVHFAGPVSDVEAVYAAADAFVLPSRYEPFGMAPLEALACGLPVVVPAASGVAEVLADGREGALLAQPDDAAAAADFLARLARDPAARRAFAARARRTAERLDLDEHVERVLAVYRAHCGRGAHSSSSTECSPGTPTRSGNP